MYAHVSARNNLFFKARIHFESVPVADQGEAARQKEWELADEDERADILMAPQLEELFW
jgi:hypothetical protein